MRWVRKMIPPAPVIGDEHPCVDGKAEDSGLRHGCPVIDEGGFDGELEGADRSGRAGDEIGEIGEGDGEPRGDAVDRDAEQKDCRDKDHAFAGPDDDGLEQKQSSEPMTPSRAGSVEGEGDPVFDFWRVWNS